ncbi:MAG: L-threonylcarbamoyladenylate synthase [Candidatus Velthaea sp.]
MQIGDDVADAVMHGCTVVFPTDVAYALGCDPCRSEAVARVCAAADSGGLDLYVADAIEALEYCARNVGNFATVRCLLPGPLTLVVERPGFVTAHVTGGMPTLRLRVPEHALCAALLERCGPLAAATVAPGPRGTWSECDVFVDNGPPRTPGEATVLDLTAGRPRLVREGIITMEMLEKAIGRVDPPLNGSS